MEYGIICLLPPIIAIALALKTKQTLPSLFIAVWVGATIIKGWNPIAGFTAIISEYMIPSIASEYNAGLLVLVTMAGGFAYPLKHLQSWLPNLSIRRKKDRLSPLSAHLSSATLSLA